VEAAWADAVHGTVLEAVQVRWRRSRDELRCLDCARDYAGEPVTRCPRWRRARGRTRGRDQREVGLMCLGDVGRLTETWSEGGLPMGRVRTGPLEHEGQVVCLMYVPEAVTGQRVLVHLGYAVEIVEPPPEHEDLG
jgi:hydrogenase maturation factor